MIQTLEAKRLELVLESGRTKPLVIECVNSGLTSSDENEENENSSLESRRMVVKAVGLPEIREQSLFCELLGNLLAHELGILTAAPALISLTDEFVYGANLVLANYGIQLQAGVGVGCRYLPPLSPIIGTGYLKPEELEQATLIYAYDLLAQNPDRHKNKPNCALHNGQILAFDFELCFSFLMPIIG